MNFYKFALRRLNGKNKILWVSTFFTALLSNVAILATPIIQRMLLNEISNGFLSYRNIIYLCMISILGIFAVILENVILSQLSIEIQKSLQRELLENAVRNNMQSISSRGPGAYMVGVFGDSERVADLITLNIWQVILQIIMVVGVLIITTTWSPLFIAIVLPSFVLMIAVQYFFDKGYIKKFESGREKVYAVNPCVLEYLENRKTVLGYADINSYEGSIYELFDERDSEFRKASILSSLSSSTMNAIKTISLVLLFVFSLFQIQTNQMQVATFVALISYFGIVYQPVTSVKALVTNKHQFAMYYDKIEPSLQNDLRLEIPKTDSLKLVDCSFEYNGKNCLQEISLNIDKRIGLVGLSGEGKTTLIKMLLGDIKPIVGDCSFGGKRISEISRFILYSNIRYYSQDIEIFDKPLEFNIALGKKGVTAARYDEEYHKIETQIQEMMEEVKQSRQFPKKSENRVILKELFHLNQIQAVNSDIEKEIIKVIDGLDAPTVSKLGRLYVSRKFYVKEKYEALITRLNLIKLENRNLGQRGSQISGGEKNRIALARFLLPEFGDVFILDEPLTNVDVLTENECLNVLEEFLREKKGIIISHKMNIIKLLAEHIVVLSDGRICENGTHEELIKENKLYNTLWQEYIGNCQ